MDQVTPTPEKLCAVKTLPKSMQAKSVPPKPVMTTENHPDPSKLFETLDNLSISSQKLLTFKLTQGLITDKIRGKAGIQGRIWISLDPTDRVHLNNRVAFEVKIDDILYNFDAGVLTELSNVTKSQYFCRLGKLDPSWINFSLLELKFVERTNEIPREETTGQKRDLEDKQTEHVALSYKKGKNFVIGREFLYKVDTIVEKLTEYKGKFFLRNIGNPIPEKKKMPKERLWLCLADNLTDDDPRVRTFKLCSRPIKYSFRAIVDTQRHRSEAPYIEIVNDRDWKYFEIRQICHKRKSNKAEENQPVGKIQVSNSIESPAPQENVDDGGLQPMDQDEAQIEVVAEPQQDNKGEDLGLGAMVTKLISQNVKRLKAEWQREFDLATETHQKEISTLKADVQRLSQFETKCKTLTDENELLKMKIGLAQQRATVAEKEFAMLEAKMATLQHP